MTKPKSPTKTQALNLSISPEALEKLKNLQKTWNATSLSEVVRRLAFAAAESKEP